MLVNLHVRNLALLKEADVDLQDGLNILTGETGAGKSLLIGSVQLALGGKVSRNLLHESGEPAYAELTFEVTRPHTLQALSALGIEPEDGAVVISRKIPQSGRSVCRINGETFSASAVRQAASLLLDLHGQHEYEALLTKSSHLKYLDAFAKDEVGALADGLSEAYHTFVQCKKQYADFSKDESERSRQISFLQFEIDEITQADLKPGEDERLEAEYRRMLKAQKLREAAQTCSAMCAHNDPNALDLIGRSVRELSEAAAYDGQLEELAGRLAEIESLLADFNLDLASWEQDLEMSQEKLAQTQQRLDAINHLKTRYGRSIGEILQALSEKEEELDGLLHYESRMQELKIQLVQAESALAAQAEELSAVRREAAKDFCAAVEGALKDLNFLQVHFEAAFTKRAQPGPDGIDDVRFLISTNPGEPLRPLDEVASGGELSRIMLGIRTVLARNDEIDTLIFDEIDAGISGRTAQKVAEKLKMTAACHQIICITHLPQIAAMADAHYLIEKNSTDGHTLSEIMLLSREESVTELARMLGGAKITDSVLASAEEMKELAEGFGLSHERLQ